MIYKITLVIIVPQLYALGSLIKNKNKNTQFTLGLARGGFSAVVQLCRSVTKPDSLSHRAWRGAFPRPVRFYVLSLRLTQAGRVSVITLFTLEIEETMFKISKYFNIQHHLRTKDI